MSTRTDPVCVALAALWTPVLTGVEVKDGPQVDSQSANEWLWVGYDGGAPDEGNAMAEAEEDWMTFGTKQETNRVKNAILVHSGDTTIPTVRARAFAILATAETALRADRTLGGIVMHALLTGHQYYPAITTAGAKVRVVFTVTYQAQIS